MVYLDARTLSCIAELADCRGVWTLCSCGYSYKGDGTFARARSGVSHHCNPWPKTRCAVVFAVGNAGPTDLRTLVFVCSRSAARTRSEIRRSRVSAWASVADGELLGARTFLHWARHCLYRYHHHFCRKTTPPAPKGTAARNTGCFLGT